MANSSKRAKPDSFQDAQITSEEPDKISYADRQKNLDPQTVADVEFRQTRPIKEAWSGTPRKPK